MIETERLLLRKFVREDLDRIQEIRSDPDVVKFIGGAKTQGREWNSDRLDFQISSYEVRGFGLFALIWKETGDLIGWCGLARLEDTNETEIGYGIAKAWWGKGIAYEAAHACLKWGFENTGLERIVAVANPENNNSWGIMKKLGMTYEGNRFHYGDNLVYYAILKEDFMTRAD